MNHLATYTVRRDRTGLESAFAALYSDAQRRARARHMTPRQVNIGLVAGNVAVWLHAAGAVLHQL